MLFIRETEEQALAIFQFRERWTVRDAERFGGRARVGIVIVTHK